MKVSDILRLKDQGGSTLFSAYSAQLLTDAVKVMAEEDIGSLMVMERGELVGVLTFREVIQALHRQGGNLGALTVAEAMDAKPLICPPETDINEMRRLMLESHARYVPVMGNKELKGVISFYDVAKSVLDSQNFENQMLKAYIKDWPSGSSGADEAAD